MEAWLNVARSCLSGERTVIGDIYNRLEHDSFREALKRVDSCRGTVVLSGVGKSGLVARRGAAVLTSLGVVAHFVHPTDGLHGDCGFIRSGDVLLALSHSGQTAELNRLVEHINERVYTIAVTSDEKSPLAKLGNTTLLYRGRQDGGVHGFIPTVSCAAQTAYLDALAVGVSTLRDVSAEQFKMHHPGGNLGRTL